MLTVFIGLRSFSYTRVGLRDCGCALALVIDEGSKLSYPSLYSSLGSLTGWRLTDCGEGCNGPFACLEHEKNAPGYRGISQPT